MERKELNREKTPESLIKDSPPGLSRFFTDQSMMWTSYWKSGKNHRNRIGRAALGSHTGPGVVLFLAARVETV